MIETTHPDLMLDYCGVVVVPLDADGGKQYK